MRIFHRSENMKKNPLIFLSFPLLIAALSLSCNRTLETEPLERVTDEYLWDSQDSLGYYARNFLSNIYLMLPGGANRIGGLGGGTGDVLATASDDAIASQGGSVADQMTVGGYSPLFNPDDVWIECYEGIRKATIFLNNFPVVPLRSPAEKRAWLGEARFIRAFLYFELVKRYGGVPLMGDEVRDKNDDLEIPRNSFAECIQYIVNECDAAVDNVRTDPVDRVNEGRITRGGVLALKAKVLLYAASPLYNGGNIGGSAEEKRLTGYESYDPERWKLAADAARAVIDLNAFELQANFLDIFLQEQNDPDGLNNTEVILARLNGRSDNIEKTNAPVGYPSGSLGGAGRTSPTQELVDAFPMQNGLPITDPASGYDPSNPYKDRDPRLSYSVFHNGSLWLSRLVETFNGGADRPGGTAQQTRTGYYMRKFMGKNENKNLPYATELHHFILFRYAEVLLNYAEALNEYQGPVPDVYSAIEAIRERAGLVPFQLPADLQQEEMRELIRNERRIELAFEEHRFRDIRRWKIAEDVYGPQHGMRLTMNRATGVVTYQREEVRNAEFDAPKMYFYPIPYNEMVKNDNMVQNPGW